MSDTSDHSIQMNAYAQEAAQVAREHGFITPPDIDPYTFVDDPTVADKALGTLGNAIIPLGEAVEAIRRENMSAAKFHLLNLCEFVTDLANNLEDFSDHPREHSQNNRQQTRTKLVLIASEVCEAIEAVNSGNVPEYSEELADIIIRLADLTGTQSIDIDGIVTAKHEKNKSRPYMHGKQA
jgi:NTP pyrophosphatase (non-canonical NTP hydrolase)